MLESLRLGPSEIFNNDFQRQTLRKTVVRGGLALVISQGMSFGLSMINTIILARLLVPSDFGIIGMVSVFVNFLVMFKDAGLSTATIQNENINSKQISTLFWINFLISLGLGLIILISSPLVAAFYNRPELSLVTAILSISFILQGLTIQHSALLQRHLKFTALAIIDIIAQISSILVAVIMAKLGFRYWALVGGTMARSITLVILTFYSCPWVPSGMQKGSGVKSMLRFGGNLTASNFVGYFSRNLDKILIGRFIGAGPLGLYTRAFHLLMQPLSQIRGPLTSMSLPVLSSLKNDPERYRSYFRQLLDISISLSLPISVYCFLESDFLIEILLGQKWIDAVPVFKVFSIAGVFVATSGAPGLVMLSQGFSKRYLNLTILTALITSVSFIAGIPFGILGVAYSFAISSFLIMIPLISIGFKGTHIKIKLILESISGPLFASFTAAALTYTYSYFVKSKLIANHLIMAIIFFIVYLTITLTRLKTRETLKYIIESVIAKKKMIVI